MSWDFRVTMTGDQVLGTGERGYIYEIREVYYGLGDDPEEKISGWTQDPVEPFGESLAELRTNVERHLAALDKPAIDITDPDNPVEVTPNE